MKKIIIVAAFVLVALVTKAQLVPIVDTSTFHPIVDTSVHGFTACKIATIYTPFNADSITRIALKGNSDNLKNYADMSIIFLNSSLQPSANFPVLSFTLQDDPLVTHITKNYTDVQNYGVEYLFQVIATYLKTSPPNGKGVTITFK